MQRNPGGWKVETETRAPPPSVADPTHPQDLPGDVGDPVLLERIALGVLHEISDGPSPAELHDELQADEARFGSRVLPAVRAAQVSAQPRWVQGSV